MEYIPQIALYTAIGVAVVFGLISVAGSLPVLALSKARLEPLSEGEAKECLHRIISRGVVDTRWAADNDFRATGAFCATSLPGSPKLVAWTHANEPTYLCVYMIADDRTEMDFVTVCGDKGLTTGTTKDGQLLPTSSDNWMQTFSPASTGELWNHHQDALEYLAGVTDFQPQRHTTGLPGDFARALQAQGQYVRSLLFWPLRMPYWYFVRRNVRHNKSVRQLYGT